jgi:hypothetical protein
VLCRSSPWPLALARRASHTVVLGPGNLAFNPTLWPRLGADAIYQLQIFVTNITFSKTHTFDHCMHVLNEQALSGIPAEQHIPCWQRG